MSGLQRLRQLAVLGASLAPLGGAQETVEPAPARHPTPALVVFAALGDLPYSEAEILLLEKQLEELAGQVDFVVHLGDIKPGILPCLESIYEAVAKRLRDSPVPCFVIPGDNEWNDCLSPPQAWQHWTEHLARLDAKWTGGWNVSRQPQREGSFAFVRQGVLFVGIHLVGGRLHDEAEWRERHAQDLGWVKEHLAGDGLEAAVVFGHAAPSSKHRDFFDGFFVAVRAFERPVLYLHGDGHRWTWDPTFGPDNLLRVQVDQGGSAPPVRVSVTGDQAVPFRIDRRLDWGPPVAIQPKAFAHAHNDYVHSRPLLDALDHGFTSVEVDVFLQDGELRVGHEEDDLRAGRTIETLYLDPLWQRFRSERTIYREGAPVQLLVDFKSEAVPTWRALQERLARYRPMLTRIVDGEVEEGAVTIAISGNRPVQEILEAASSDGLLDGRIGDWDREGFDARRFALVSTSWSDHFGGTAPQDLDGGQRRKLAELIASCREQGLPLRFWGTKDGEASWRALREAGVAWLQADDFEGWCAFLR